MSQTFSQTTHELNCPNCGASYEVPLTGNQATCAYCGSRFVVPASVRAAAPRETDDAPSFSAIDPQPSIVAARWIKWLVIFIVVVTVVPTVCGIGATICGALAPLGVFLFR